MSLNSPGGSTLQYSTWLWNNYSKFVRWQHPAMWNVALKSWHWICQVASPCNVAGGFGDWGDMPLNSPKRSPYWNSTSGFDFDHITAVDMSCCTSLRNFIQIGPPSAEKNDVISIFKMAELCHLGFYGSSNGFLEKPMYDLYVQVVNRP